MRKDVGKDRLSEPEKKLRKILLQEMKKQTLQHKAFGSMPVRDINSVKFAPKLQI